MNVVIKKSSIGGKISAIPSKSYAHRALICNFLAGDKGKIIGLYPSVDITATKSCINALKNGKKRILLDCAESGSTLRFLIPVCSALGGEFEFVGRGKLMQRPIAELTDVLSAHGMSFSKDQTIIAKGKLTSGEYKIRGDISSQYITGLLMALPILNGDSEIILTTPLASKPYVDITISVLSHYGIKITATDSGFIIKGNQKYQEKDYVVEGDWSNAGYMLTAGAIYNGITVDNLKEDSLQSDKIILSLIKKAGANVIINNDSVKVESSNNLTAFEFSAKDCPDVVPAAAILASFANGETVITDIERLKIKESDRVKSVIQTLKAFNINAYEDNNTLKIIGGVVKNGKADSFNDHRIAMFASILALGAKGDSVITGAEAVNKSYPTFYEDLKTLKGDVKIEV